MGIAQGADTYKCLVYKDPKTLLKHMKTKEGIAETHKQEWKLIKRQASTALFFLIASEASMLVFDNPSRRLCNISWILYMMFVCSTTWLGMVFVDRMCLDQTNTNICLNSINLNALLTFVGCNLLCGLINITT